MDIRPIKTDADYEHALADIERLWGAVVLNGQRKLSLPMIRRLHTHLRIPLESLIGLSE